MSKKKMQPLRDSFNRRIDYLRISVTDKCNLRCVYCMPSHRLKPFRRDSILSADEILRFVKIAAGHGLRKVRITGGEPLLRKDLITIISGIKGLGIQDLSLTTNGVRLPEMASDLKKAGLDRVNISMDTLNPDRYRGITGGGDIRNVLQAIHAAEEAGLTPVKINMVPVRGLNDDEIPAFASMTIENNYHIRFIELMPAKTDSDWRRDKCIDAQEVMQKISALGRIMELRFHGRGPSRNYRIEGARGVIGIISPVSDHFCRYCNRMRMTAEGRLRPCLFSDKTIDIRTPMRKGASDYEIETLFINAVRTKPERHHLDGRHNPGTIDSMSKIGG
jgi:cyclic pyranopterin phosphate synthase